jgi:LmbE family N-acetylglucosaminyl deacetylase
MGQRSFSQRMVIGIFLPVILLAALQSVAVKAQSVLDRSQDTYKMNNREPDPRFKADLLLIVAHDDDEADIAGYLARAIDQKRRVAIVWVNGTGQSFNGGRNLVGPERADSLAAIRVIEGLRAVAVLGITNAWNLGGSDNETQNLLESFEANDHGMTLGRVVRLVRLTRPEVIISWLPEFVTGENHADHQASGILAAEAFDLAGDPTAFPEQVSPATEPGTYANRTEGLRTWQPQKLYFFANATHEDFYAGKGPEYNVTDISPTRNISYADIARQSRAEHQTQYNPARHPPGSPRQGTPAPSPVQFILGKSLVGGSPTDDVFAGVVPGGIPYQRPPGYLAPRHVEPVMEMGDPWHYYYLFWQAHGLDSLLGLIPYEISITQGTYLSIPLIVDNPTDAAIDVNISVSAPQGWKVLPTPPAHIEAQVHRYYMRAQAAAPAEIRPDWQMFTVTAESGGKTIGTVPLRVQLARDSFRQ